MKEKIRTIPDLYFVIFTQFIDQSRLTAEVHVWYAEVREEVSSRGSLSRDEWAHGMRFHRACDRNEYLGTRLTLRRLLAAYLKCGPEQVSFQLGEFGKPFLLEGSRLFFNVSHSGGCAALAFSRCGEVGVDLEKRSSSLDCLELSRQFFAAQERVMIEDAFAEKRRELFYQFWVRKEAYLKAKGTGLQDSLDTFEMTSPRQLEDWFVSDLKVCPADYSGALASPVEARVIEQWLPAVKFAAAI